MRPVVNSLYFAQSVLVAVGLVAVLFCTTSCSDDSPSGAQPAATSSTDDETGGTSETSATSDTGRPDTPRYPDAGPRPKACPDPAALGDGSHTTPPLLTACPAEMPDWFADKDATPAPTLTVRAGTLDSESKAFVPWVDGQWAPVHWGMRMGAGVWVALHVELPGETADTVELELDTPGMIGCKLIGTTMIHKVVFTAVPGEPGVYSYGTSPANGACVLLAYTPDEVNAFCDHWMVVTLRLRVPDTDVWGEISHVVRLYID